MLIHHFLETSAARYPDKVAVIHGDERVAYRDLNARADNLAAHLQVSGIIKGDRIALLLENGIDYIVAYYATLKAGAVAAPLNPGLKPDGLQSLLTNLEPAAIITNFKCERLLKAVDLTALNLKLLIIRTPKQPWNNTSYTILKMEDCLNPTNSTNPINSINSINPIDPTNPTNSIHSSDMASIIYTSGSEGKPKGVMLSHANIVANTTSICQYLMISPNDIQMVVLPFFYVMGKSLLNTHIASGGAVVINNQFAFPATVIKQMAEENVTAFSGVPSTYAYLLHRSPLAAYRDKLPHLRYCSQAGGHMPHSLKEGLQNVLPNHTRLFVMYGATEASARLAYLPPEQLKQRINSIGKPIPGVTLTICDPNGHPLPDGNIGEITGHGDNIMIGYWKNPAATAKALGPGGYRTGDLGYRDADGYYFITGRMDNQLKVGGHRINTQEIEDALASTGLVIQAAVVGVPDDLSGNRLIALIVPKTDSISAEQVFVACAKTLPRHKRPASFLPRKALPLNANGKVDLAQCKSIAEKAAVKTKKRFLQSL